MSSLMTDRYEFSMLQSLIAAGKQDDRAVFEVFTRRLPKGRRFGIFAGLGRLIPMIKSFQFGVDELDFLTDNGVVNSQTRAYLRDFRFTGEIDAYLEGDLFFPHSPVMTITGTLGECILLETLILSVLNFDSAVATTAARMVQSAMGRPIIEMGSRRTNEDAAAAAARAAYIAGFDSTSNLLAGQRYGIPTRGTAAHAFTLSFEDELEAFRCQVATQGKETTLLVDTYDIEEGIRNAVKAAGTSLGAIRIDSGDLANEADKARQQLDGLGAFGTRIVVTSDLDEFIIKDLHDSPIDGYGVGTKLVSNEPMGFVYKLVEINGRPVAKKSADKNSVGGRKYVHRFFDGDDKIVDEVFTLEPRVLPGASNRRVQVNALNYHHGLVLNREVNANAMSRLPLGEQKVWHGDHGPYITCHQWEEE